MIDLNTHAEKLLEIAESTHQNEFARQHQSTERATTEGSTLLTTVHGGFCTVLVAWIQTIFISSSPATAPLAKFLVIGLATSALGLLFAALIHVLDTWSSQTVMRSTSVSHTRLTAARLAAAEERPRSEEEKRVDVEREAEVTKLDGCARTINRFSNICLAVSWIMLLIGIGTVALGAWRSVGLLHTITSNQVVVAQSTLSCANSLCQCLHFDIPGAGVTNVTM